MKNLAKSLVLVAGLSTLANANMLFPDTDIQRETLRIQKFMDSFIDSSNMNKALTNFQNLNYPRVDMQEKKEKYIITFELAGMDKNDIKLSLEDNILILEGEKKTSKDEKSEGFIRQEIFYGKFKKMIHLANDALTDKLSSKFENGILRVTIPRTKVLKSKSKILKID